MRKSLLALWIFVASLCAAPAQMMQDIVNATVTPSAPSGFTGVGDIVSGAKIWFGLRAYNAAYAASLGSAITIRRASDNTTQTIAVTSAGNLNIAAANTFAGTDATCSGTISGTTATLSGCSSTPTVGDTLTGTGIIGPSFVTAVGTFTSGAGTVTLNEGQTVSSSETITFQVGMFISEWFDQSGTNFCSSAACNISVSTAANQYELLPNCFGSLPCAFADNQNFPGNTSAFTSISPPWSLEVVGERFLGASGGGIFFDDNNTEQIFRSSANTWEGGTTAGNVAVAATDAVAHGATFATTTTGGVFDVDGVTNTGTFTTPAFATPLFLGNSISYMSEFGVWAVTFSSGNQASLCHNQFVYWGSLFGTSC